MRIITKFVPLKTAITGFKSKEKTNLAPSRRQTASMTVCTSSGGFVKTRISEISLLSSASRAYKSIVYSRTLQHVQTVMHKNQVITNVL